MTVILEGNMITRQMTPFFPSAIGVFFVGIFHFCISRSSNSIPWGLPWYAISRIYMTKMTLSSLLTQVSVFYIKFLHNMFCSQFDTNLVLIPLTIGLVFALKFTFIKRKYNDSQNLEDFALHRLIKKSAIHVLIIKFVRNVLFSFFRRKRLCRQKKLSFI